MFYVHYRFSGQRTGELQIGNKVLIREWWTAKQDDQLVKRGVAIQFLKENILLSDPIIFRDITSMIHQFVYP